MSSEENGAPERGGSLDHVTVELDDALRLAVRAVLGQQDGRGVAGHPDYVHHQGAATPLPFPSRKTAIGVEDEDVI